MLWFESIGRLSKQRKDKMSAWDRVLSEANLSESDKLEVSLYAHFLMNTWIGARPSDCARRALREFEADPDSIRNRRSGYAPER